ncbi:hypothetical protein TBLA_0E02450 [Henningerozyma blattae CBS 6284]|uniref:DNA polymerase gamma n=1 Tax=Henningerozyma blattae (strain ATCC 34711 / CBS 6284 / DSM 70876 / NBRC 10599 / NRRL Y-10934 / UCD 77-7) TaxID=1071380 RepID=I2H4J7_HENB6|nr:hypothetical protein TBLA_0E02450 [Tetrapisispora blattae CBS 6284]CCH61299.1 hypothetical protein TBLA_0E02450 [Tetrapisispora blattae CBS 6284]
MSHKLLSSPLRNALISKSSIKYTHKLRSFYSIKQSSQESQVPCQSDVVKEELPTVNPVGIQYLSRYLHKQLFKQQIKSTSKDQKRIKLAKRGLNHHKLLGKKTSIRTPIQLNLPELQGNSLDEHFQRIGNYLGQSYKDKCIHKFTTLPQKPRNWLRQKGWVRYVPGKEPIPVDVPLEDTIVFDVETLYKISHYPTLAVAVSSKAWYLWCSPYISEDGCEDFKHLISLGDPTKERIIIGHNVSYDRARVSEEYNLVDSKSFYMDTLSLHIATTGLCSRQRSKFMQTKRELANANNEENANSSELDGIDMSSEDAQNFMYSDDPWLQLSSMNSLKDVAWLHCRIKMNKDARDYFAALDKQVVIDNFQMLVNYCMTDVEVTSKVFDKVFPTFLKQCPHPISFAALRYLSKCILPTNNTGWNDYINRSEDLYQTSKNKTEDKLIQIVEDLVQKDPADIENDPWLSQLDWETKPIRMTKKGVPVKNQKLPGYPEWYKNLFPRKDSLNPQITLRTRIIPLLFKLSWEDFPVIWSDGNGWCFRVPKLEEEKFMEKNYRHASLTDEEELIDDGETVLFKIPHPNGPELNCTTLMSKPFLHYFDKGILKSRSDMAKDALTINASGSYWMSARERIMSQFVVPLQDEKEDVGLIVPKLITMGTVTRRAVENTWLTASNAKNNRIGSELKAMISAPTGYSFVGADVDSEELWIASLVGDSVFKLHGGTAIGWMCLEGTKNEGTDLHTKTAEILGCTRNEAKVFNYGRIYGAGVRFASQLLKNFNPNLSPGDCSAIAKKLYESTKGKIKRNNKFKFPKFWYGGSESILFNQLEQIAEQPYPRTPVLGCGITKSLQKGNLNANNSYLPSRINWCIQSSGVDYLHLLVCSMDYLIQRYQLKARLCITIHDEIRYLVKEEDKYKVAMALQISNLWTRSIFCEQMGIYDLPQNCAFFTAIDIDHILRKEVDMDCVTPSNQDPLLPFGESLDIYKLLEKIGKEGLGKEMKKIDTNKYPFKPREHVLEEYNKAFSTNFLEYFLEMQLKTKESHIKDAQTELEQRETEAIWENDKSDEDQFGYKDYLAKLKQDLVARKELTRETLYTKRENRDTFDALADKQENMINELMIDTIDIEIKSENNSKSSSQMKDSTITDHTFLRHINPSNTTRDRPLTSSS